MSPLPGTDPAHDALAAVVLEQLVTDPAPPELAHLTLTGLGHLRRPGDLLLLNAFLPGQAHVTTSLPTRDTARVLREVADHLEAGGRR